MNTQGGAFVEDVFNKPAAPKAIFLTTIVQPGEEQTALNFVKQTAEELNNNPITEEELDIAKKSLLNEFNQGAETSDGITNLAESFFSADSIDAYANYVENINNLTVKDLNNVAKNISYLKK